MPSAERWPSLARVSPQTSALDILSVKQQQEPGGHPPTNTISPPEHPRTAQPQPTPGSVGESSPLSQADYDAIVPAPEVSPTLDFSPVSAAALERHRKAVSAFRDGTFDAVRPVGKLASPNSHGEYEWQRSLRASRRLSPQPLVRRSPSPSPPQAGIGGTIGMAGARGPQPEVRVWSGTGGGELPAAKRERHATPEDATYAANAAPADGVAAPGQRMAARGRRSVLLFPTKSAGGTVWSLH